MARQQKWRPGSRIDAELEFIFLAVVDGEVKRALYEMLAPRCDL